MARTNRRYAANRMRANNPMHRGDARERMRATLREIGHRPPVRKGNGLGPSEPQRQLATALGWPMEVAVRTGMPRGSGYPTCYKLDIADPTSKVGIEVDGASHGLLARKAQDAKKERFLAGLGWTVLRFSNQDVTERLAACVQTVRSTTSKSKAPTLTSPTG